MARHEARVHHFPANRVSSMAGAPERLAPSEAFRARSPHLSRHPIRRAHAREDVEKGGRRAAAIYTLIATAKLNDIDPQAWLADVLARLPDHPAKRVHELLPWNWRPQNIAAEAA